MPIPREHLEEILSRVEEEQDAVLRMAPLKEPVDGLPASWVEVLRRPDAHQAVLATLWQPMASRLPKTLAILRRSLRGVGLLSTKKHPLSLVYVFQQDDEAFAYRGFVPAPVERAEATQLPADFVDFFARVHDGWVDVIDNNMGPLPVADWHWLGADANLPAGRFLVVFRSPAGVLGFDFRESPPMSYVVWSHDPPDAVPHVWQRIDRWLANYLEDLDPA